MLWNLACLSSPYVSLGYFLQALVLNHSTFSSSLLRRFGISSSASPEPSEKDQGSTGEKNGASIDAPKAGETKVPNQAGNSGSTFEFEHHV